MNEPSQAPAGLTAARKSTYYLLAGFAISWFPMPIAGLAVVPLVASLIYAVLHLVALRKADAPAQVRSAAMAGVALTTLLIALVAAPLVQYGRTLDVHRCLWGANTKQAEVACKSGHEDEPGGILGFLLD